MSVYAISKKKKIPPTDLKTTMSNFDEREERRMKLQGKGGGEDT